MRVELIENPARLKDLQHEWGELLAHSASDCLFLSWEWLSTWWRHLAGQRRLHLLLVHGDDDLAAIAPMTWRPPIISRLLPFSALEFLGSGIVGSDYLDIIVRTGVEQNALETLTGNLTGSTFVLELARVSRESAISVELARRLSQMGWSARYSSSDSCPFIDLAGHSWESYLTGLGSAHRYNFQRRLRNLNKQFNVKFEMVHTELERRDALEALVSLHAQRWRTRGGSETFSTQSILAFHDQMSRLALERGWLRLFVLRLNGAPAAVFYGYRYGRTFSFYQSAFASAFAKFSLGLVTMGLAIRQALDEGADEFDMLHGAEPYKFHWARNARILDHVELFPPGARGAVYRRLAVTGGAIRRSARHLVGDSLADRIVNRGWRGRETAWPREHAPARIVVNSPSGR